MELYVEDLIPEIEEMKFLFLLESPYKEEVKQKIPLAGNTGKNISNFFLKKLINIEIHKNYPFGCYLNDTNDARFGIMNCSNKPLDKKLYSTVTTDVISFDRIRRNPRTKIKNRDSGVDQNVHKILYQEFEKRLLSYHEKNYGFKIICCGLLAKTFFEEALENNSTSLKMHEFLYLPHPSFNLWQRVIYKEKINELIQALKNYL